MSNEDSNTDYLEKARNLFDLKFSSEEELNETQNQMYAEHISECGSELIGGYVLANSDSTNEFEFPKGQVILYPSNSTVNSTSIHKGLYDHLILSRILPPKSENKELNDSFFRKQIEKLNEASPQKVSNPPRLHHRDYETNKDMHYWSPSLGSRGWAGILKTRHRSGRDEDSKYFVAVKAGVDQAVDDFISDFSKDDHPKQISYENLIRYDRDHGYLRKLGERNAKRLAFKIAEAIGVRIHVTEDNRAYTNPRTQEAKPSLALTLKGDFCQSLSSLKMVTHHDELHTKPLAAAMNMCTSPDCVKEQCLIMIDPYVGLIGLKMNPDFRNEQPIQIKSIAIPVCTGRLNPPTQVKLEGRDIKKRLKGVTWESKIVGKINDKLAPDAYRQFDDESEKSFIKSITDSGWNPKWGMVKYVPVVMKISNRKLV